MKIKKQNLIPLFILLLCFVFVLYVCVTLFHGIRNAKSGISYYQVQDFKQSKKDFKTVAKELIDIYNEERSNNSELESIKVFQSVGGIELECKTDTETYMLTKTMSEEYLNAEDAVRTALSDEHIRGLFSIKVTSDTVTFNTYSPYSVVYTKNGARPDTSREAFIDRLSFHFFQKLEK